MKLKSNERAAFRQWKSEQLHQKDPSYNILVFNSCHPFIKVYIAYYALWMVALIAGIAGCFFGSDGLFFSLFAFALILICFALYLRKQMLLEWKRTKPESSPDGELSEENIVYLNPDPKLQSANAAGNHPK